MDEKDVGNSSAGVENAAPAGGHHYVGIGVSAALLLLVAGYFLYDYYEYTQIPAQEPAQTGESVSVIPVVREIASASLALPENEVELKASLEELRDIAADENAPVADRAQALNGINFAYTKSNYNAAQLYEIVFSKPPFSVYYEAPESESPDPLHPERGGNTQAIEHALLKLNAFSNALAPSHYAITRLGANNIFAYQREATKAAASEQEGLRSKYAQIMRKLIAEYDALPPLLSVQGYPLVMRIQNMYAFASMVAFIGNADNDKVYIDRGEEEFKNVIAYADEWFATNPDRPSILNESILARIFYAAYYWRHYKETDPDHIKDVLRPLLSEEAKQTVVYKTYLPSHKDSKLASSQTLREIAAQMPELKAFLEGRGWKF